MTDQEIIQSLKDKIRQLHSEYLSKVRPYEKAIQALGERSDFHLFDRDQVQSVNINNLTSAVKSTVTMKQKIRAVLSDARKPLTSREIMDAINEKFPDNIYTFSKFSGNFSQTYPKAGIKRYIRPEEPIKKRVVYGLEEWFDGDELRPNYKELLEKLL